MSLLRSSSLISLGTLFLVSACSSNTVTNSDGGTDAGQDAGTDGGVDGGLRGDGGAPPAAPILSFTTSLAGVQLAWTLPGAFGGEQFQVLRADQSGPFQPVGGAQAVTADAYSDLIASALPGAVHQYEVTATNGNGVSAPSNIVEVPQAPGDLVAGASDTRVLLVWGALQNAASYDVYRLPAADGGSSPTKLANVTQAEFVDDGSTLPIATGSSYSYQVVAQPLDGGQPSTGSNHATTKALGIDISDLVTHVTDVDAGAPVAENSQATVFAVGIQAGTLTTTPLFSTSSASVIPGIANGPWYFSYGDGTFLTVETARSVDIGGPVVGRADVAQPLNLAGQTVMAYDLLGLDPWTTPADGGSGDAGPGDTLESVSVGAGNFVTGLEDALDDGGVGITAGGSAFVGNESIVGHFINTGYVEYFNPDENDLNLVDSTQGDQYYVTQLHQKTSANGQPYQAVTKSYTDLGLQMADGATAAISSTLAVPTAATIANLEVKTSQFVAQKAAVNPAATSAGQTVSIVAEKDFALYGNYTLAPTLLRAPVPGSATADTSFGAVAYGNPFPANWETYVEVKYGFHVAFDLKGDNSAAIFNSVSGSLQPSTGYDFTSVAPQLSPVTNLQIGGKSAFSDQVNVTTSPVISWTAPAGSITPSRYVVSQYELALNGTATVIGYYLSPELQDEVFTTTATSFTLPGTLTSDSDGSTHWYFVTVDAIYESNGATAVDAFGTPFHHGTSYVSAQAVSNKFAPGAGTLAPSHYLPATGTRAPPSRSSTAATGYPTKLAKLLHAASPGNAAP